MKHRSFFMIALAAVPFAIAAGQVAPTPPVAPVRPEPVVAPVVPVAPVAPTLPLGPMTAAAPMAPVPGYGFDRLDIDELRYNAQEMRDAAAKMREDAMFAAKDFRVAVPFEYDSHFNFNFNFNSPGDVGPRPAWAQGDAADSLWRLARETINRTDYSKAAQQFSEIVTKYPSSRYAPDAAYYEAFARYRVGTLDQLRQALKTLDANTSRVEYMSRKSDVPALRARILSALSSRGDRGADDELKKLYAQYPNICDQERIGVKSQVLNSMYQSDPEGTMPLIRQQLQTRDACSAELRRTAVFLLANRPDEQKAALIAEVAKTDTVREVRRQAIEVLSRMPGEAAINTLQELMRDGDEQIQSSAVRALMRSDNPRARIAMRTLIDRKESPERQRIEAIQSYDREMTADDANYLRTLYGRESSERVKEAIINALGRTGTEDNVSFLLKIAQNGNEPSSLRSSALNRISRMSLSVDDLGKLYDASDSRTMRRSLVNALGSRNEPAAVNKLLEIVKLSTDPEVQAAAISVLINKKDPEVSKKLAAVINP
jgi:HEAT repeat protein/outer membrane protein assembly factor BamD (BamD/ComL family)